MANFKRDQTVCSPRPYQKWVGHEIYEYSVMIEKCLLQVRSSSIAIKVKKV